MNKNEIIKKTLPLFIAAVLMLTLFLGLAAPVSAEGEVCEIVSHEGFVVQQYFDLSDALTDVQSGETIRLLDNIDHNTGIYIDGIVTFNVNGFTLNVEVDSGDALIVEVDGRLNLNDSKGGALNVISLSGGAGVRAGGWATVTNAFGDNYGVYASGGVVTVNGNVTSNNTGIYATSAIVAVGGNVTGDHTGVSVEGGDSTIMIDGNVTSDSTGVSVQGNHIVTVGGDVRSENGIGIYAEWHATVTVDGDVTGGSIGVETFDATVTVGGDVTGDSYAGVYAQIFSIVVVGGNVISEYIGVEGDIETIITVGGDVTGDNTGVYAGSSTNIVVGGNVISDSKGVHSGGQVTIDGTITVNLPSGVYIELYDGPKKENEFESSSTKSGYFEYADYAGYSVVWVRDPSVTTYVCEIVETDKQYTDLENAVTLAGNGQTIRILTNIDCDIGLSVVNKIITFDVNGFVLNVEVASGDALTVSRGGVLLNDSAGGELNVISHSGTGVKASGWVTVTNAFGDNDGVNASNGFVTVNGDVASNNTGVSAASATVAVGGDVTGDNTGVFASDATVTVGGNVTGDNTGVSASHATVAVGGDVTGGGDDPETAGVLIHNYDSGSTITVGGDLMGGVVINPYAQYTEVTVDGDLMGGVDISPYAQYAEVTIEGNYDGIGLASSIKPGYFEWTDGTNYIWWRDDTDPTYVCEIVDIEKQYTNFGTAVALVKNGQTIRLLDDIDYDTGNKGLEISGKNVTLDVNGYTLNVKVTSEEYKRNIALVVNNGGKIQLDNSAGGEFNVICSSDNSIPDSYGVSVNNGSVTVTNVISDGHGVYVSNGSKVTIDGTLTMQSPDDFDHIVLLNGARFTFYSQADGVHSLTKRGYFEYTDGTNYVWIRDLDMPIYSIGFTTKDVTENGVTATGTIKPTGQQVADVEITVTITLTGTAEAAGTHTVGLTSMTLGAGTIDPATVTKKVTEDDEMNAGDTFDFLFLMPESDVIDLVVTHTFAPPSSSQSGGGFGQAVIVENGNSSNDTNQTPDIPPETDLPDGNPDGNQTEGGDGSGGSGGSQNGGTGFQNIRIIVIVAGVIVVVAGAAAYLLNRKKFQK